ncbi:PAS domain-containing sensor histidine kinase [Effusibacillus lacus]|uniref:Sensor histidine kinase n=1 Tax=Effusibacillus lacus TaxID=1348429 RepID=A0A292YJW7_9BACL|nr:PAS domain-containing sensor histidine kinase [Effusibacillus lacus]TCS76077.1 two-component system sensor histidine kinase NreB [Effusibacillus lacus]GAX91407.1 histidine kinase [Effusibacillus lacus]
MAWLGNLGTADKSTSVLESIFTNVTDAILIIDEQGFVAGANPAAERMTGWSAEELIGKIHFCDICRGMANCVEEASCVDCFAKRLSMPSFEMKLKTKDGNEYAVAASSTRLIDQDVKYLVVILRDMSEQHRMERERIQRMMTNYVIQAQEEERKRVSRDLHDGVGQALYSILVGLKVVNQLQLDDNIRNHLEDVQQMTTRALEEVKSLAVELRPSALDDLGLVPAIRSYNKRYEQTFGIETELEIVGNKRRYAPVVETALYRICQEAMTNSAKYADCDKIMVRLVDSGDMVELYVEDDGRGFDTDQIRIQGTGLGLYGMKERANLLGGTVEIKSAPGEGTVVHVMIPLTDRGEPLHVDPGTYSR